jgi:hypothetical protein
MGLVVGKSSRECVGNSPTHRRADETLVVLGPGIDLTIRGIPDVRLNWGAGDIEALSLFWAR